jgi:hypothetical protein
MKKKTETKSVKKVVSKSDMVEKAPRTEARPAKLKQRVERSGVQEALQVTWLLKGNLKNAQLAYLRIGALLVQVRDKNLYSALGHADMVDYAEQRLQLGKTSLYKYLKVYDWVSNSHPEWLQPKPKGFIPDLSDIADLIWIENELVKKDIVPEKRTNLQTLQKKALAGTLRQSDLVPLRRREHTGKDGINSFLKKLRLLRKRGSELASMPSEVISHLDAAIEILKNNDAIKIVGIDWIDDIVADRRQIC